MKVVVNAGPLIALGKLGVVALLPRVYGSVLVPSPVHNEVVLRGMESGQPDAYEVQMSVARGELTVVVVDQAAWRSQIHPLPPRATITACCATKPPWPTRCAAPSSVTPCCSWATIYPTPISALSMSR
jgi:hypothetical protein